MSDARAGSPPIEDHALIGDTETAALVTRDGTIDWLCLPRFDSDACFAAFLGTAEHGHWSFVPRGDLLATRRRYRPDSLVLETELETRQGVIRITDCMPRGPRPEILRRVEGLAGRVALRMTLAARFGYGQIRPWISHADGAVVAIGGPDALSLWSPAPTRIDDDLIRADLELAPGERIDFELIWHPSWQPPPARGDVDAAIATTDRWWRAWAARCTHQGPWRDAVMRSLVTLKALTYAPTGGIVAAPTTSLPEMIGGGRNWDYRFCWLRDATFTLFALMDNGYLDEAAAWREWLVRAIAGDQDQLQIVYGIAGERRLDEIELPWLPGYRGTRPVRIGNAAYRQFQLDVCGELLDCLHQARIHGLPAEDRVWAIERGLVDVVERRWREPDQGIWESRGEPCHFTYSKVMAWVALDRAVQSSERYGRDGPVARWKALRARIHDEVCARGFDRTRGVFTQSFGSSELDANLLLMPVVGFLPPNDPRIAATIDAIAHGLEKGELMRRYRPEAGVDGLTGGEGVFLACSFWLVDALALRNRKDEATDLFERLLALRNDVGLLAEEHEPHGSGHLGNFPQAFSHVALINSAKNLGPAPGPSEVRSRSHESNGARR